MLAQLNLKKFLYSKKNICANVHIGHLYNAKQKKNKQENEKKVMTCVCKFSDINRSKKSLNTHKQTKNRKACKNFG